jgi:tRNA modification GTPase
MIDMMSVGLAGSANTGKSSLINYLLDSKRSIVADVHGTTRDVITGMLELDKMRCAIFDCAGLKYDSSDLLDTLANQAATDSLKNADIVILCIDASNIDYDQPKRLLKDIDAKNTICILTKCDLLSENEIAEIQTEVESIFAAKPIATSTLTGAGIDKLKTAIEKRLLQLGESSSESSDRIAINQRHKQIIETAIKNLDDAKTDIESSSEEVATMMLRNVYQNLGSVETEHIDEAVLDNIFANFCIGK